LPLNDDLRRFWREAGGTGEEGSAAVCMPAPAGCSRVYYLTSAEYATSNVVFRRLKVARFSELNDPFELLAPTAAQKRSHLEIRKYRENFDVENGLLCFSSDWIDPVLWSHYGAQHHGICLGFNVPNAALRNVNYQTDRMVIDTPTIVRGLNAAFADTILRTKFESWKYEKEKRMLVPLSKATREGRLYFVSLMTNLRFPKSFLDRFPSAFSLQYVSCRAEGKYCAPCAPGVDWKKVSLLRTRGSLNAKALPIWQSLS
jgi:hypothetical protein